MRTALADLVTEIHRGRKTGLLAVTVRDSRHLLKFFFTDGEISHIAHEDLKNAECLSRIDEMECLECSFLPAARLNSPLEMTIPIGDIIGYLKMANKTVEMKDRQGGAEGVQGFAEIRDKLRVAFIRQMGPIGEMIFGRAVQRWTASSNPTKEDLLALVALLKEEIDEESDRAAFAREVKTIVV